MVQTALIEKIKEAGLSQEAVAANLKISRVALNSKLRGRSEFKVSEAKQMMTILNLSRDQFMAIFFTEGLE